MIRITNSNEFKRIIASMEQHRKNVGEIFENENTNMEKINATEVWSGDAQEETYNKYLELKQNYEPIMDGLRKYIDVMKNAIAKYEELDTYRDNLANDNRDNLTVNS